jgi:ElaB/YqjD/DUF883 family membrane-anchored ribosome-binding protein
MSATLATGSAGNGPGRVKETVSTPFKELFDGVDDLIRRVADVENPEIRRIRARVHAAMVAAKGAAANGVAANGVAAKDAFDDGVDDDGADAVCAQAVQIADPTDGDLRDYPQALGVALLMGLGLGLIVSSRL